METSSEKLKSDLISQGKLPSPPTLVQNILAVTQDPKSGAKDVESAVEKDQSCSVKLLKLANSAYYGFSRQVKTIKEAVVIIGLEGVKNVAMSLDVANCFIGEETKCDKSLLSSLWVHSMATATLCQSLSKRIPDIQPSFAYCAGLLHDLGKVVLCNHFGNTYRDVVAFSKTRKIPLHEVEKKALSVTHSMVGVWMAEAWDLPDVIKQVMQDHHDSPETRLLPSHVLLTRWVDALSYEVHCGYGGNGAPHRSSDGSMAKLKIQQKDLDVALLDLKQQSGRFIQLLKLE